MFIIDKYYSMPNKYFVLQCNTFTDKRMRLNSTFISYFRLNYVTIIPHFCKADMKVPLVDLTPSTKHYKKEIFPKIKHIISAGNFILGDEIKDFENYFAAYVGTK